MPLSCSFVVVGATVVGCTWYLTHLARGPHGEHSLTPVSHAHFSDTESISVVVWTKSNPTPWNNVKQDENVKLMAVNQKFDKRFVSWVLLVGMTSG